MFKLLILLGSFISAPAHQVYQTYQHISDTNKTGLSEEENKVKEPEPNIPFGSGGTVGRAATIEEITKFDYLVPNWQWFTKLRSDSAFGYTDLSNILGSGGAGLCEYISMGMLLEYQELFVSSGFFTDSEWNQWFDDGAKSETVIASPIHKNHRSNGNPKEGLVRKLFSIINKVDLKSSKNVQYVFDKFLVQKPIHDVKQARSASWAHSSHPSDYLKKERVPVMFSFVSPTAHNITIYGYNSRTDELAFHIGWPDLSGKNSMRIVRQSSLWSFWSMGFWNTIYIPKNNIDQAPRKAFIYEGKKYSWKELQKKGKDWSDISPI